MWLQFFSCCHFILNPWLIKGRERFCQNIGAAVEWLRRRALPSNIWSKGGIMLTIDLKLEDISRDDVYDFSFPQCSQRYTAIEEKFPGLPLLIVDRAKRVVWGHDYLRLLLGRGQKKVLILEADFAPAAALLLNFNLSNRLFGLNLYEKLLFVKKISSLYPLEEIQRRADLGFNLNDMLFQRLDALLSDPFRQALGAGQLGLKAAMRLADIAALDRLAVLGFFMEVKFSESHQLQIIQLLEEIAFHEKKSFAWILAALGLNHLLKLEMPQHKIMEALNLRRFPACSRLESEWQQWQKKMTIPGRLLLAHVPFFASEKIQISLTAQNKLEAEELLKKLK